MGLKEFIENKRVQAYTIIIASVFFLAVLFFFNPAEYEYYPPCWFKTLSGYYCPGCGGMRGIHLLLNGHFTDAFRYNPLSFIAVPFLLYFMVYYSVFLINGKRLPVIPVNKYTISIPAILLLLFWILRNL